MKFYRVFLAPNYHYLVKNNNDPVTKNDVIELTDIPTQKDYCREILKPTFELPLVLPGIFVEELKFADKTSKSYEKVKTSE